jgi:hypothetical protein
MRAAKMARYAGDEELTVMRAARKMTRYAGGEELAQGPPGAHYGKPNMILIKKN